MHRPVHGPDGCQANGCASGSECVSNNEGEQAVSVLRTLQQLQRFSNAALRRVHHCQVVETLQTAAQL